ncbi:MAG: hypothetical protein ABI704_11060 [Kofleriaceae bacterium]
MYEVELDRGSRECAGSNEQRWFGRGCTKHCEARAGLAAMKLDSLHAFDEVPKAIGESTLGDAQFDGALRQRQRVGEQPIVEGRDAEQVVENTLVDHERRLEGRAWSNLHQPMLA